MTNTIPEMELSEGEVQKTENYESQQDKFTETTALTTLDSIDIDDKFSGFEYFLQQLDAAQRKAVDQMFNHGGLSNFDSLKARADFLRTLADDEGEVNEIVAAGLKRLCCMLDEIMDVIRQLEQQEQQILDEPTRTKETEQDSEKS